MMPSDPVAIAAEILGISVFVNIHRLVEKQTPTATERRKKYMIRNHTRRIGRVGR